MNACIDLPLIQPAAEPASGLAADAVRAAVQVVLCSPVFSKAPRMKDLLLFLLEKKLAGQEQDITEYAIGLQVFRRDARVYDTMLDPVVRVQVGRLRDRLAAYYANTQDKHPIRISIPAGSYVPLLQQENSTEQPVLPRMLELTPLRDLTGSDMGAIFVAGVDEELNSKLFRMFGHLMQVRYHGRYVGGKNDLAPQAPRRIEGSVRVDQHQVRASLRVIDNTSGRLEWTSQFDCHGELGIRLQEELADAMCDRLQGYLGNGD